ncbi:[citrate (pro-3S)-lyase] ligase [Enterococcus sp. HY326]|uniref:[citrate (pro-3S)-lyase] ligase n=1 Tax=Enterococcus sp. HY326 TaxID=2971265 RepID=UPI0022402C99|nr:[citrate (pro-3S)-lyase] ligase [Enterococcus sp. HY326]
MNDYLIGEISPRNKQEMLIVEGLLEQEGITLDANLDYTCGVFDRNRKLVATGSCFKNSLRCIAIDEHYQGEGIMNQLISHLIQYQFERGNDHLFVYTKKETAIFFEDLGFYTIAKVDNRLVFLENRRDGFKEYLTNLVQTPADKNTVAAIVMNANPFTFGHQKLIEKAAAENDWLHLFMVSEDESLVPYAVRKKLMMEGTQHLKNISYQETGSYLISMAIFPSYFLKEENQVIDAQASLDGTIFANISQQLGIQRRYMGTEPTSRVTELYNQNTIKELAKVGVEVVIVPRFEAEGEMISASTVRQLLVDHQFAQVAEYVPKTTLAFFETAAGQKIIDQMSLAKEIKHY